MVAYQAFDPDVEVHGQTILRVVDDALARFSDEYREMAREALAANGVEDPDPTEWYPQQAWLDSFEVIATELEPHILDRLGEQIPDIADWPAGFAGVEEALRSIDEAYQINHRGGEIGYYRVERIDDKTADVQCRNPYPCPIDRGIIRAVARENAPVESFVFVDERGMECRRDGADQCTYTVSW